MTVTMIIKTETKKVTRIIKTNIIMIVIEKKLKNKIIITIIVLKNSTCNKKRN